MKEILLYSLLSLSILSCTKQQYEETIVSFDTYQIEDGFQLQALVVEPLLEAPVDISFDDQGRLWAIEMAGYMQTIEGLNPKGPIGMYSGIRCCSKRSRCRRSIYRRHKRRRSC